MSRTARLPRLELRRRRASARARRGWRATSRAAAPRSSFGTSSRLPMISTGIALANAAIRSTSAPRPRAAIASSRLSTRSTRRAFHRRDVTGRQRAGDQLAHARVQRRIVEDQARRVVLEERRGAVLGQELLALVGAEGRRVLVDGDDVGVAAQEHAAVGHALHRRVLAQGAVGRERVVVEGVGQALQVEVVGKGAVVGRHGQSLRAGAAWNMSESVAPRERVRRYARAVSRARRSPSWPRSTGKSSSRGRPRGLGRARRRRRAAHAARQGLRRRLPARARRAHRHLRQRHGRARADRRRRCRRAARRLGRRRRTLTPPQRERAGFAEGDGLPRRLDRRFPARRAARRAIAGDDRGRPRGDEAHARGSAGGLASGSSRRRDLDATPTRCGRCRVRPARRRVVSGRPSRPTTSSPPCLTGRASRRRPRSRHPAGSRSRPASSTITTAHASGATACR